MRSNAHAALVARVFNAELSRGLLVRRPRCHHATRNPHTNHPRRDRPGVQLAYLRPRHATTTVDPDADAARGGHLRQCRRTRAQAMRACPSSRGAPSPMRKSARRRGSCRTCHQLRRSTHRKKSRTRLSRARPAPPAERHQRVRLMSRWPTAAGIATQLSAISSPGSELPAETRRSWSVSRSRPATCIGTLRSTMPAARARGPHCQRTANAWARRCSWPLPPVGAHGHPLCVGSALRGDCRVQA